MGAALSDGCFSFDGNILRFHPAPPPSVIDLTDLLAILRRRIFRRMLRMGAVPYSTIAEMMSWPHSGFTLDSGTRIAAGDRDALKRLLLYFLRPVLSLKKLTCGGEMKLVAVILDDRELDRILAHQGWPVEFPKTKASRAPPRREERGDEGSQEDPRSERWEGRQEFGSEWPA